MPRNFKFIAAGKIRIPLTNIAMASNPSQPFLMFTANSFLEIMLLSTMVSFPSIMRNKLLAFACIFKNGPSKMFL